MDDPGGNPALDLWLSSVRRAIEENREVTFPVPQGLMPWMDRFRKGARYYEQLAYLKFAAELLAEPIPSDAGGSDHPQLGVQLEEVLRDAYMLFAVLHPLWKDIVYAPQFDSIASRRRVAASDIEVGAIWWLAIPFQTGRRSPCLKNHPYAVLDVIDFPDFSLVAVACLTSLKSEHVERGLTTSQRYRVSRAGDVAGLNKNGLFDLNEAGYVVMISDLAGYVSEFDFVRPAGKLSETTARELVRHYIERQAEKHKVSAFRSHVAARVSVLLTRSYPGPG